MARQPARQAPARQLLTLAKVAESYPLSVRTLRRYIASGRLPAYRLGARLLAVDAADVEKLAQPLPAANGRGQPD